jgi:aminoglycoside phosphotransferase (APT) family kinase protein
LAHVKEMAVRAQKMHADEVNIDVSLVRRLLAGQFPQWAHLPIEPVQSTGTDNAIYRLGDELAVRLPRIAAATGQVEKEQRWLPKLAPLLPLAIPCPLAKGAPAEGYPWHWSVYRWLDGETATIDRLGDPCQAAAELAGFVTALRRIDPTGGPPPGAHNSFRGVPLARRDAPTRAAIVALMSLESQVRQGVRSGVPGLVVKSHQGALHTSAVTAAWEAALQAPAWHGPPVWIHGDLSAGNLLAVQGRLSAVIDFGCLGVGDPACDLMAAWTLFSGESRQVFRAALAVDDATWARGRGWALSWALIFIPYYVHTNPAGVAHAWHAIDEVLADHQSGR